MGKKEKKAFRFHLGEMTTHSTLRGNKKLLWESPKSIPRLDTHNSGSQLVLLVIEKKKL